MKKRVTVKHSDGQVFTGIYQGMKLAGYRFTEDEVAMWFGPVIAGDGRRKERFLTGNHTGYVIVEKESGILVLIPIKALDYGMTITEELEDDE